MSGTSLLFILFQVLAAPQDSPAPVEGLDETTTRGLATQYRKTELWTLKAVILTALGRHWHPSGAEIVIDALNEKDARVRAFALEALRRADPETLKAAARAELMDALVNRQLKVEHPFFRTRVLEVLKAVAPDAGADLPASWTRWWSESRATWKAGPWTAPRRQESPDGAGPNQTRAESFVERAFDLNLAGIEAAICIDATGSMQPTIDAARDAVGDMMAVLRGISPRFRLGVVWYRDFDDHKDGADILLPLTPQLESVHSKLRNLTASGGGDIPERVEKGLEFALSPAMGWQFGTNKIVVLVGDAPPHPKDVAKAVGLARKAHEEPFGAGKGGVATGSRDREKPKPRGFIVSALGVGRIRVAPPAAKALREIATAGGGTYGEIVGGSAEDAVASAGQIVGHVLAATFGEAWADATGEFVKTYLEYRKNRFFD